MLRLPAMAARTKARGDGARVRRACWRRCSRRRSGAEEALAIYRELGDLRGVVGQLNNLGVNRRFIGDYDGARHWLEQSVRTCRELGDRAAIASALSNLADVRRRQGHYRGSPGARSLEALALFGRPGTRSARPGR